MDYQPECVGYRNLVSDIREAYKLKLKSIDLTKPTESTKKVITFFNEFKKELGHKKRTQYDKKGKGEFLYDISWSIEDKNWEFKNPHYLDLVVESEWKDNWTEIATDFGKLLDSKAPIKIGICKYKKGRIEKIKNMIKTYQIKIPKEYYLIFLHDKEKVHDFLINNKGGCFQDESA